MTTQTTASGATVSRRSLLASPFEGRAWLDPLRGIRPETIGLTPRQILKLEAQSRYRREYCERHPRRRKKTNANYYRRNRAKIIKRVIARKRKAKR